VDYNSQTELLFVRCQVKERPDIRDFFVYNIARPFTLHPIPCRLTLTFYSLPSRSPSMIYST
jgi:hypothetical protein